MNDDRLAWKYPGMLALLIAVVALLIGGCGGDGDDNSDSETAAANESKKVAAKEDLANEDTILASIGLPRLGMVLIDHHGLITLYEFSRDKNGKSSCYGACAKTWRPMLTKERPSVAYGAYGDLAHMTKRRGGTNQAVYAGHPVYYYSGDKRKYETNGEGARAFGGVWRVVRVTEPAG